MTRKQRERAAAEAEEARLRAEVEAAKKIPFYLKDQAPPQRYSTELYAQHDERPVNGWVSGELRCRPRLLKATGVAFYRQVRRAPRLPAVHTTLRALLRAQQRRGASRACYGAVVETRHPARYVAASC